MRIRYHKDSRLSEPYTFENVSLVDGQVVVVPESWLSYRSFDIKVRMGLFEVLEEPMSPSEIEAKEAEEKAIAKAKADARKAKRAARTKAKKEAAEAAKSVEEEAQASLELGE